MNKLSLSFIFILLSVFTVEAQVRLIYSSNHITSLNGPELTVYQYTGLTMGAGSTCPPLDSFWVVQMGNNITIDVLYNTLGAWPAQGCSRVDTIIDTISPCNPCELVVNAHAIGVDTVGFPPPVDTLWNQDNDTSYFSYLSSSKFKLESDLEVYPNPASGFLYLKGEGLSNSTSKLVDISGRKVRVFEEGALRLDVQGIRSGIYFLAIEKDDGAGLVRKVLLE